MLHSIKINLLFYATDSQFMYQQKDIAEIENKINENFEKIRDWFVGIKLSIHCAKSKTKSNLFGIKRKYT